MNPDEQVVRFLATRTRWQGVEGAVRCALTGELPRDLPVEAPLEPSDFAHAMLRWAVRDGSGSAAQWSALQASHDPRLRDRDRYVAELWRAVRREPAHGALLKVIRERGLEAHYQAHLFHWLLRRFDLAAARELAGGRRRQRLLHLALTGLAVAAAAGALAVFGATLPAAVAALALALGVMIAGRFLTRVRWGLYVHSLIPRLGVGIGIGYLFLATAPDLPGLLGGLDPFAASPLAAAWALLFPLLLAGGSLAFTALHVARRVHPEPPARTLLLRSGDLLATAAAYAAVGLAFFAPLLYHPGLLSAAGDGGTSRPGAYQLALTALLALGLGVVLQLAWEERPLTEPL